VAEIGKKDFCGFAGLRRNSAQTAGLMSGMAPVIWVAQSPFNSVQSVRPHHLPTSSEVRRCIRQTARSSGRLELGLKMQGEMTDD
jgi:hypothetical protein